MDGRDVINANQQLMEQCLALQGEVEKKNEHITSLEAGMAAQDTEIAALQDMITIMEQDQDDMAVVYDEMVFEKEKIDTRLVALTNVSRESVLKKLPSLGSVDDQQEYQSQQVVIVQTRMDEIVASQQATIDGLTQRLEEKDDKPRDSTLTLQQSSLLMQANFEIQKKNMVIEALEAKIGNLEMQIGAMRKKQQKAVEAKVEEVRLQLKTSQSEMERQIAGLQGTVGVLQERLASGVTKQMQDAASMHINKIMHELTQKELVHLEHLNSLSSKVLGPLEAPVRMCNAVEALCELHKHLHSTLECACNDEPMPVGDMFGFLASLLHRSCKSAYFQDYVISAAEWIRTQNKTLMTLALDSLPFSGEGIITFPFDRFLVYAQVLEGVVKEIQQTTTPTHQMGEEVAKIVAACESLKKLYQEEKERCYHISLLTDLASKLFNVPDEWPVVCSTRRIVFEGVYVYVHPGSPMGLPFATDHPHKNKHGESVRVWILSDTVLLTTWKYKYRYRFDLDNLNLDIRDDVYVMLYPDMLVNLDVDGAENFGGDGGDGGGVGGEASTIGSEFGSAVLQFSSVHNAKTFITTLRKAIFDHMQGPMSMLSTTQLCSPSRRATYASAEEAKGYLDVPKMGVMSNNSDEFEPVPGSVHVYLRARPFVLKQEKDLGEVCLQIEGSRAVLDAKSLEKWKGNCVGVYEHIFGPERTQQDIFGALGPNQLSSIAKGFKVTMMCYGNTGAGKTYTMIGDKARRGLIPRIIQGVFTNHELTGVKADVSYFQVYNNRLEDLLKKGCPAVKIKNGKIKGLTMVEAKTATAALKCFSLGNANRTTHQHNMNAQSSRGHAILLLTVTGTNKKLGKKISSTVHLVDLAGSENATVTGTTGIRMKEAKFINKSLVTLSRVIHTLSENQRRTKGKQLLVPFRDSILTQVMRDSLSDKFVLSVVLNVSCSPALQQAKLTWKTMTFGEGLKRMHAGKIKRASGRKRGMSKSSWTK